MFSMLNNHRGNLEDEKTLQDITNDSVFENLANINILPLIYNEKKLQCNILVFDYQRAKKHLARITFRQEGSGRKHPVYRFFDGDGDYICEVRYGSATANALQRGFWTHTKNALKYFRQYNKRLD